MDQFQFDVPGAKMDLSVLLPEPRTNEMPSDPKIQLFSDPRPENWLKLR
jgi:hypothetical protein